jgi:hypothetical protein
MFDKLLHHKLLTEGLEGEGVITEQKVEGSKGQMGVMGFYVGVEGHHHNLPLVRDEGEG